MLANTSKNNTYFYLFITIITGIAYFLVFAHRFVPAVVAVDISNDLGANASMLGMLSSGYFYMYGLFQMPAGVFVDAYGSRKVMTISFIIAGIGGILFGISPNPTVSFISRLILGLGCAAILVSAMTLLARVIDKDKFPTYLTLLYVIGGLGPLAAAAPLAFLSSEIGWRNACLSIGIFTLIYAFILFFTIKDSSNVDKQVSLENKRKKSIFNGVGKVSKNFNFWLIVVFGAGVPSIYLIYCGLWAGPYMSDVYLYDKQMIGNVLSFGAIGSVLGFFLGPIFSDKILKSRKKTMIIFSLLLFIVLLPFIIQIKLNFIALCIQVLLIGVLSCGVQPVAIMAIKDIFSLNITGTALGMFNTFPLLCGGLLQFLIGIILQQVSINGLEKNINSYALSFSLMSIACFIGLIAIIFFKENQRIDK